MLWALISSVYVIYLYRKLAGEMSPPTAKEADAWNIEIVRLEQQIAALEARHAHAGRANP